MFPTYRIRHFCRYIVHITNCIYSLLHSDDTRVFFIFGLAWRDRFSRFRHFSINPGLIRQLIVQSGIIATFNAKFLASSTHWLFQITFSMSAVASNACCLRSHNFFYLNSHYVSLTKFISTSEVQRVMDYDAEFKEISPVP